MMSFSEPDPSTTPILWDERHAVSQRLRIHRTKAYLIFVKLEEAPLMQPVMVSFILWGSNSPEGTYAVITKHGEFLEIKKSGGIYMCMPYVR